MAPTYSVGEHWAAFSEQLTALLRDEQIVDDLPRRLAYSTDASFYHLTPRRVLVLDSLSQVCQVLQLACRFLVPVTFRAAGTSLSGQAVSDSVLILLSHHWRKATVLDNGQRIAMQPGLIGAQANRLLAPYQRKIGPDPASINTCKIGGIVANNASGMCCGVRHNSYHTLAAMQFVLADGTLVDTRQPASVANFYAQHRDLIRNLQKLRDSVRADAALCTHIRHQFRLKNTMGYGLQALLDFDEPVDIISHLLVGSEGTLGFIGEVVLNTVPVPAHRATGLFLFDSADAACAVLDTLASQGAQAIELMDSRALRAVQPLLHDYTQQPITDTAVALLVEISAEGGRQLSSQSQQLTDLLTDSPTCQALQPFSHDADVVEHLWAIRKGLFPAVGAVREAGTTVIIEDVAFDRPNLASGIAALTRLLQTHGYQEAIIFGHALDGNLHFVFTQAFTQPADIQRYAQFMQAVSTLVSDELNGTLKAEHGTGRNMAPFLEQQWGKPAVAIMKRLKQILDPDDILNPGVILNADPQAHLSHLKHLPAVDPMVDACIECGFCEPACPSRDLTLTPRQRIALQRRAVSLTAPQRARIEDDFAYLGDESCAATGMCASRCPVNIDTGAWIKARRARRQPQARQWASQHIAGSLAIGRWAVRAGHTVKQLIPKRWQPQLPAPLAVLPPPAPAKPASSQLFTDKVVYLVGCPNRMLGNNVLPPLTQAVVSVCNKAGIEVVYPDNQSALCCGQPFASQGNLAAHQHCQQDVRAALSEASEQGRWPVVADTSACALALQGSSSPAVQELSSFLLHTVLPRLAITPASEPVALHITCASQRSGQAPALLQLARQLAKQVVVPDDIACCGFAGDKGFTLPELNQAALHGLAEQLPAECRRGFSTSRTCELGLSRAAGIPYNHIVYLMNEVSKPLPTKQAHD